MCSLVLKTLNDVFYAYLCFQSILFSYIFVLVYKVHLFSQWIQTCSPAAPFSRSDMGLRVISSAYHSKKLYSTAHDKAVQQLVQVAGLLESYV